jgi:hypothetical protein
LFLLNHPFVREQSRYFAQRLLADNKASDNDRLALAYSLALGRKPLATEVKEVADFLAAYQKKAIANGVKTDEARLQAWQSFAQTLFCRNEFLYVE